MELGYLFTWAVLSTADVAYKIRIRRICVFRSRSIGIALLLVAKKSISITICSLGPSFHYRLRWPRRGEAVYLRDLSGINSVFT